MSLKVLKLLTGFLLTSPGLVGVLGGEETTSLCDGSSGTEGTRSEPSPSLDSGDNPELAPPSDDPVKEGSSLLSLLKRDSCWDPAGGNPEESRSAQSETC